VIVIADNISPALEESADEVLLVPAEGTSFFPSLTSAMSVQIRPPTYARSPDLRNGRAVTTR
jgi:hypothetical protein